MPGKARMCPARHFCSEKPDKTRFAERGNVDKRRSRQRIPQHVFCGAAKLRGTHKHETVHPDFKWLFRGRSKPLRLAVTSSDTPEGYGEVSERVEGEKDKEKDYDQTALSVYSPN